MTATSSGVSPKALKVFARELSAYSKVCLKIRTKQASLDPFRFNESQKLVHEILADQYKRRGRVRAIILKARQQGMSTYTAARFFRRVHLWPHQQAIVVADQLDRAQTLFGMYDRFAHNLPEEMRPMMRYVSKKKEMVFDNPKDAMRAQAPGMDSGIAVETAGDAAIMRGSTIQLAHLSEMAFWPNALDVWVSLMQAVPDKGSEVIIESTANGVGNLFHQVWLQADEGEGYVEGPNGFIAIFIPWWFHGEYCDTLTKSERKAVAETLDDTERKYVDEGFTFRGENVKLSLGQIAWRRRTIMEKMHGDDRAFRQEYPATAEEAFLVSGSCFFDEEALRKLDLDTAPPKRRYHLSSPRDGIILPQPTDLGYLRIWEMPDDESIYVIAADTAEGKEVAASTTSFSDPNSERGGRDFSSADVIDIRRRKQVAQLHGRMAPEIFAEQLNLLGRFYSCAQRTSSHRTPALLAPEANHSSGETVIHLLKTKYRYPHLYQHRQINRRWSKRTDMTGWRTTVETRMPMLDNLAANVREGSIKIMSRDTIREMTTFVRGEDGKPQAQEGAHDDRVISLGIACFLMDQGGFAQKPKHFDETELVSVGASPTGMYTY